MLPKKNKVPRALFLQILKKNRYYHSPYFLLRVLNFNQLKDEDQQILERVTKKPLKENRFSFIVSKTIFKKATERNLLKRRCYSIIKKNFKDFKKKSFFLFFAKKEINKLSFSEIEKEIMDLLNKAQ